MRNTDIVEIRGHLIDSGSLSRVLNDITDYGGDYVVQRFDIGHGPTDPSYARIEVSADDEATLRTPELASPSNASPGATFCGSSVPRSAAPTVKPARS